MKTENIWIELDQEKKAGMVFSSSHSIFSDYAFVADGYKLSILKEGVEIIKVQGGESVTIGGRLYRYKRTIFTSPHLQADDDLISFDRKVSSKIEGDTTGERCLLWKIIHRIERYLWIDYPGSKTGRTRIQAESEQFDPLIMLACLGFFWAMSKMHNEIST